MPKNLGSHWKKALGTVEPQKLISFRERSVTRDSPYTVAHPQDSLCSYKAPGEERSWTPISTEESLQTVWRDVPVGPRGLQLQCRVSQGETALPAVGSTDSWKGSLSCALSLLPTLLLQGAWGRPVLYQVVAQYNYCGQRPEDLDFHQGDTVDVLCEGTKAALSCVTLLACPGLVGALLSRAQSLL